VVSGEGEEEKQLKTALPMQRKTENSFPIDHTDKTTTTFGSNVFSVC
jgi:hypothetical protein